LGAPQIVSTLEDGLNKLQSASLNGDEEVNLKVGLGTAVLNTAKRFGKARFAQVAARYVAQANDLPPYVEDALDWLME
jgi:putative ATP-dependent endonuclease of OLD family